MKNLKTNAGKALVKRIEANEYYSLDRLKRDAKRYAKAIEENRVICSIQNISSSGMNRDICFTEFEVIKKKGSLCTFYSLFEVLGYQHSKKDRDYFKISGCGMDMVFHTNYTIINDLIYFGLIPASKKSLEQNTPRIL